MRWLKILIICFLGVSSLSGQNSNGSSQREEIHRYMGFEVLPFRYMSLPYDVSMNVNEKQVFVDIGYLYFTFLPLLFIVFLVSRPKFAWLCGISLFCLWFIGISNSFVYSLKFEDKVIKGKDALTDYLLGSVSFLEEPFGHIIAYIQYLALHVYEPILGLVEVVSGNADSITYPLLSILFVCSLALVLRTIKDISREKQALVVIFWAFLFFWFKYSAGIVWYGYLALFLSGFVLAWLILRKPKKFNVLHNFIKYSFFVVAFVWMIFAVMFRMGEIHNGATEKELGKAMFSNLFYDFQLGRKSNLEVLNAIYPNFDKVLAKINSDDSKILRIGTSFTYFFNNNDKRVQMDNQLVLFHAVFQRFGDDIELMNKLFKASDFKYIIVDVNTPFIDQTPEQTLKKKYKELMKYIKGNMGLELLNTNRVFQEINPQSGKYELYYKMFPDRERQSKIYYGGQYAIYEIL